MAERVWRLTENLTVSKQRDPWALARAIETAMKSVITDVELQVRVDLKGEGDLRTDTVEEAFTEVQQSASTFDRLRVMDSRLHKEHDYVSVSIVNNEFIDVENYTVIVSANSSTETYARGWRDGLTTRLTRWIESNEGRIPPVPEIAEETPAKPQEVAAPIPPKTGLSALLADKTADIVVGLIVVLVGAVLLLYFNLSQ